MFRSKTIFGGKVRSCKFENEAVELLLQCAALNRMIQIAKPDSRLLDDQSLSQSIIVLRLNLIHATMPLPTMRRHIPDRLRLRRLPKELIPHD